MFVERVGIAGAGDKRTRDATHLIAEVEVILNIVNAIAMRKGDVGNADKKSSPEKSPRGAKKF